MFRLFVQSLVVFQNTWFLCFELPIVDAPYSEFVHHIICEIVVILFKVHY